MRLEDCYLENGEPFDDLMANSFPIADSLLSNPNMIIENKALKLLTLCVDD